MLGGVPRSLKVPRGSGARRSLEVEVLNVNAIGSTLAYAILERSGFRSSAVFELSRGPCAP
jgi:hypothetical protein